MVTSPTGWSSSPGTSGSSGDRDGLTLFLVDAPAKGLTITRTTMVDNRNAATVKLDGVAAEVVLGTVDQGADVLDPVLDRATAVFCAEMLGLMTEAFEHTIEYLKTREQFGVKIGTFQGLKHRAAAMFAELELSRSVVRETVSAIDDDGPDVPTLVGVAKGALLGRRKSDRAGDAADARRDWHDRRGRHRVLPEAGFVFRSSPSATRATTGIASRRCRGTDLFRVRSLPGPGATFAYWRPRRTRGEVPLARARCRAAGSTPPRRDFGVRVVEIQDWLKTGARFSRKARIPSFLVGRPGVGVHRRALVPKRLFERF